jgi:outer membrane lipoprotein-sorting protein
MEESMSRTRTWILGAVLLAALATLPGYGQKAAPAGSKEAMAVVDKLIEAMGGRKLLESIKDTTVSGTAEIVQFGITVPITIYMKEPDKLRMDITIAEANMTVIQAFDGQKGWFTNLQTGATEEMPDFMAKELARGARENQALLHPQKAGVIYALKPKEAIAGKDYIVLEQTQPDGHKTTLCLDPETYLPYKSVSLAVDQSGAEVDSEEFSTNYQKVGGVMIPYSIRQVQNGSDAMRITVTAVTFNTSLDDAFFILK